VTQVLADGYQATKDGLIFKDFEEGQGASPSDGQVSEILTLRYAVPKQYDSNFSFDLEFLERTTECFIVFSGQILALSNPMKHVDCDGDGLQVAAGSRVPLRSVQ